MSVPEHEAALFTLLDPGAGDSVGTGDEPVAAAGGDDAPVFRAVVQPGPHGRGPWDHALLHGGPVGGIAGWAAEQVALALDRLHPGPALLCSRLTVELLSGVTLAPLTVTATVAKPGRRSRVIDVQGRMMGRTVLRATSQWVLTSDREPDAASRSAAGEVSAGEVTAGGLPPPSSVRPADPGAADFEYPRPGFNCDAVEVRPVQGSTEDSGPGLAWVRLAVPLIAGQATSPFAAMATLADLAAAVGWEHGPAGESSINPDITLQLARYPSGPWVAFDARNHRAPGAAGFNEAVLYDEVGPLGRVLQSLVAPPHQMPGLPQVG